MTSQAVIGIGELVTNDPELAGPLGIVRDAAVVIEAGRVVWTGPWSAAPAADTSYDVGGRAVIPGFVDSHAHLVFAGDRAEEFARRMSGTPYTGGGIRSTLAATRGATDDELAANLARLVAEMLRQGTTTVEVKSGYGLTVHDESRSLALAREVTSETTYLGAHVVPPEYADDPAGYVDLVTGPMRRWWRRCCLPSSSRPGRRTRTRDASWQQGSRWRWQPTATRAPATAARCRCASRSRSGRCG
jgi:imidazolonepropionase